MLNPNIQNSCRFLLLECFPVVSKTTKYNAYLPSIPDLVGALLPCFFPTFSWPVMDDCDWWWWGAPVVTRQWELLCVPLSGEECWWCWWGQCTQVNSSQLTLLSLSWAASGDTSARSEHCLHISHQQHNTFTNSLSTLNFHLMTVLSRENFSSHGICSNIYVKEGKRISIWLRPVKQITKKINRYF